MQKLTRELRRPSGMAIVLVLGLLSLTLALSYSMLRSQTVTAQVQQNSQRPSDARLAARMGLHVALRKMREANWAGPETAFHGEVDTFTSYDVTYATGDANLTSSSPDFDEYPFRVTVTSTGSAVDPSNQSLVTTYKATAVVQLVRMKLAPPPSNWAGLQNYTLYYWGNQTLSIEPGARIEGAVSLQGALSFYPTVPVTSSSRSEYLSGLNAMRVFSFGDHRPFNGTISLSTSRVDAATCNLLDDNLGLTLNYLSSYNNVAPVTHPGTVASYRLYPGGKQYSVPRIQDTYGSTLSNASLGPDPINNPLGVFRSSGSLSLADNARIKGSLIAEGSSPLTVSGSNIVLEGFDMPELRGATTPVQLPSLLSSDAVRIASSSQSQMSGMAVAWSPVLVEAGDVSTSLSFQGRLLAYDLDFGRRTNWTTINGYWVSALTTFEEQQSSWTYGLSSWFFPTFLKARDALPYEPQLVIKGPASPVAYQWQDWSQPIYVKADEDPGLRWELISWHEGR